MTTRAVIFDMDGTITEGNLDFGQIREEIGMARDAGPILEAMEQMTEAERLAAEEILHRREDEAAQTSTLNHGVREVLAWLAGEGIRLAILTRNSRVSVDTVLARHGLRFDLIFTREDGAIKPSAEPVLAICRTLGVDPAQTWMVGDYLFDLQSGNAAGTNTALLWTAPELPEWHDEADAVLRSLDELRPLIEAS